MDCLKGVRKIFDLDGVLADAGVYIPEDPGDRRWDPGIWGKGRMAARA